MPASTHLKLLQISAAVTDLLPHMFPTSTVNLLFCFYCLRANVKNACRLHCVEM